MAGPGMTAGSAMVPGAGEPVKRGVFDKSVPSTPSTARDHMLLGDLVGKQGKHDEALRHYERALGQLAQQGQPGEVTEKMLRQRAAQALLEKGDVEAARKMLDQLLAAQNRQKKYGENKKRDEAAGGVDLPGKLIITVPKRLLEKAGAGLSFEEFRKEAGVQYLTFPREGVHAPAVDHTSSADDARTYP
jgi:hypothetical protein